MGEGLFTADLFRFLEDLRMHNDRAWFAKNKARFQDVVQEPALEFVRGFAGYLRKISPQFVADDRPVGGSLFRIYRDVRFSKDKRKRAPSGFPADHPLMDDLKWKDHVGSAMLDERTVTSENFLPHYAELCRAAARYVGFLCESLGLPF